VRTVANQIAASMKKLKVGSRANLISRLAIPADNS
jgi:DNA-binding CsgD family transcriptional regulator